MTGWRTPGAVAAAVALLGIGVLVGFVVDDDGNPDGVVTSVGDEGGSDGVLTISRDDFVDIVQICSALDNGLTPFAPETPIATPPPPSQGTLNAMLRDCGQR